MISEERYREYLYGSARLGNESHARELSTGGSPIATLGNTVIRRRREEPCLIVGGAGSGKGAQVGIYFPVHPSTHSFFLLDMGGQYLSTTWHWNLAEGREAYAINVEGASSFGTTQHKLNLWGLLKRDDPLLLDNCRRIADMAIRDDAKGENSWVPLGAKRWMTRLLHGLCLIEGRATPKRFWDHLNRLEINDDYFKAWSQQLGAIGGDTHTTLVEIYRKKHNSEKEYGAIMGKLRDDLDWLASPAVADAVSGDEDFLSYLPDPARKIAIYYVLKSGSGKLMESLTRMTTGIAMLHCMRNFQGKRPTFYLEEAATCGGADFIKQLVSECRKYIETVLVYQSQGQIDHLFGKSGAQEIRESCGMQIILGGGIRDIDSAKRYADMIGKATIATNDTITQADRAFKAEQARQQALWHGLNPIDAERQYQHELAQSQRQRKAGRYALDPSEIMRLNNQMLIFAFGAGLPPLLAEKLPNYWTNPAMAGRFAPDPLFPPLDRITLRHPRWGKQTRKFVRQPAPQKLAHWPNHISGEVAYVKGYKTW